MQAYHRNAVFTKNLPQLVFLHGNVAVGYDNKTHRSSYIINESENSKDLLPTKLLYPIEKKDYNSNGFIKNQWEKLLDYLNKANLITVFGYSAPVTDIEARNLMIKVWGTPEIDRYMEEIEIIDIDNEIKVAEKWSNFIFSHHYSHKQSLLHEDSWLYNFPRRTGEIYKVKYYDGLYQEDNRPSKFTSLVEMWDWFSELIKYEND